MPGQLGGLPAERGRLAAELCRLVGQRDDLPLQRLQLCLLGRQRLLGRGQVRLRGGERPPGVLARHRLRRRATGPRDRPGEHPDPDPVPCHAGAERGLGPEVGPDRRLEGDRLPPELDGALVELALLGLEPLQLPLQRGQLALQGGLLCLELGGLAAQDRLLGEQLGLFLLELALLGEQLRLLAL